MAFVNESVPEDQKKILKANQLFNTSFGKPVEPYKWAIDRERDVFIIGVCKGMPSLGDDYVDPDHYAMSLKNHVIRFDAITSSSGNRDDGWVVDWKVVNVGIPPGLESQREGVLQLIRDGLDAMGSSTCNRDGIIAVNVRFKLSTKGTGVDFLLMR